MNAKSQPTLRNEKTPFSLSSVSQSIIVFLTPEDARYGFSLAGVRQVVTDTDGTLESLERITGDRSVGMIFIDERLHRGLNREWLDALEKKWWGLIIVLPAPEKLVELPDDYATNHFILRLFRCNGSGYKVVI